MSDARQRMLGNIRAALNRSGPLPQSVADTLNARLNKPKPNIKPAFDGDPVEKFIEKLQGVSGKVTRAAGMDEVSKAVAEHLQAQDLPFDIVVAPDPDLEEIPWSNRFGIERRAAVGDDRVSVTGAFAGIAETGTLVLLSGPESPTTLNFLPDDHIIVLKAERIVPHMEDVWLKLRKERKEMPRTLNLITGPSKTADVEQTIQEGAHGPRRLHVILIG
jgi:L-lactate dehydrogenase complex protein LldG